MGLHVIKALVHEASGYSYDVNHVIRTDERRIVDFCAWHHRHSSTPPAFSRAPLARSGWSIKPRVEHAGVQQPRALSCSTEARNEQTLGWHLQQHGDLHTTSCLTAWVTHCPLARAGDTLSVHCTLSLQLEGLGGIKQLSSKPFFKSSLSYVLSNCWPLKAFFFQKNSKPLQWNFRCDISTKWKLDEKIDQKWKHSLGEWLVV